MKLARSCIACLAVPALLGSTSADYETWEAQTYMVYDVMCLTANLLSLEAGQAIFLYAAARLSHKPCVLFTHADQAGVS